MELTNAHKSRIMSGSLLFVLCMISIAAILFWAYPLMPPGLIGTVATMSAWTYPVGLAILAAWLATYRREGILTLVLSGIVFYVLAVRMKGLLIYPGTFEYWRFSATDFNRGICIMVLIGLLVGGVRLLLAKPAKPKAAPAAYSASLRVLWIVATVLSAVAVYLTLFKAPPNETFAFNQPIGTAIVWVGASIGVLATKIIERNEQIDATLRHSMR